MRSISYIMTLSLSSYLVDIVLAGKKKKLNFGGGPCVTDEDCELSEMYCRTVQGEPSQCALRVGLSHPCTDHNMCLSDYCGTTSLCEFSTYQLMIIGLVIVCTALLVMAASAPPKHTQLYPKRQKIRWKISYENNNRLYRRRQMRELKVRTHTISDPITDNTDVTDVDFDLDSNTHSMVDHSDSELPETPTPPIPPIKKAGLNQEPERKKAMLSDSMVEIDSIPEDAPLETRERSGIVLKRILHKLISDADDENEGLQRRYPRKSKAKNIRKLDIPGRPSATSSGSSPPPSSPEMLSCELPSGTTHFDYDQM